MLVKICGITAPEDARAAVEAGATAVGFNFYAKSPRYVEPAAWIRAFTGALKVGVFVNESAGRIAEVMERCGLEVAQLHGGCEAPAGARVWLARSVEEERSGNPEAWLIDAPAGEMYGGTGKTYDWGRVRGVEGRVVLAGGLDASNVAEAIEAARPWGVDACSRLERAPGLKDHGKVAAFIRAALEARI
jgi:phosphoribosylanthranilate isomerase